MSEPLSAEELEFILDAYLNAHSLDEDEEYNLFRGATRVINANKSAHPKIITKHYRQYMVMHRKFKDRRD